MSLAPINDDATADSPIDGTGTILEYSDDAGATWNQIANLTDVKPHKMTSGKRKRTTHSTTGGVNKQGPAMGDASDTEFTLLYDKTAYGILAALYRVPGILWRTTFNDTATDKIEGWLSEYGPGTPLDGDNTIECKVAHTGAPTIVTT